MIEMARDGRRALLRRRRSGETVDFLEWLLELNFVLLGYREYELVDAPQGRAIHAVGSSGLGILSDVEGSTFAELTLLDTLDPAVRRRIEDGDLLVFSKTNAYATVHRRARMDYIGVRQVERRGRDRRRGAAARACSRRRPTWSPARRRRCCITSWSRSWPPRT